MLRSLLSGLLCWLLVCGLATLESISAQPDTTYELIESITKRKDRAKLHQIREHIDLGNYADAVEDLDPLIEAYPLNVDLIYMRARCHQWMKDYPTAAEDFKRGVTLAPNYKIGTFFELGELYQRTGEFALAKSYYQQFLARVGPRDPQYEAVQRGIQRAEVAAELKANPVPFDPQPLSGGVNSEAHHEYFPTVSVDGQRLLFTRRVHRQQEDFYETYRQADGSWTKARPLDRINTDFNEAAQTTSADGKLIIFTICGKRDGIGGCDLYFTEKKLGKWTPIRNMGPNINSPGWDSQPTLSADGKLLFFSSARKGGLGKTDLWGSARNAAGVWSPAVNLGKTLNTKGKDEFPFFHPDGQTLYFTSDGHPGMGGMDLFFVRLGADNRWSTPKNLGYPINTPNDEASLFIGLDGREAFFAKGREYGEEESIDLYAFELPLTARPLPTTYVQATVVDAATGLPIAAQVRFRPTEDSRPIQPQQADEKGQFLIVLPAGKNYALTVDQTGYLPYSSQFSLADGYTPEEPYLLEIALQPTNQTVLPDAPIVLRDVLFASGSAELLPFSYDELDRLAQLLRDSPTLNIEIAGHTDDIGSEADNLQLSEDRAKAVFHYLTEMARVNPARVSYVGYGESQPIADNTTAAGRSENRRTEFRVKP
ncbi:MAG: OmpA family protein [Bacteroidota bacterium]